MPFFANFRRILLLAILTIPPAVPVRRNTNDHKQRKTSCMFTANRHPVNSLRQSETQWNASSSIRTMPPQQNDPFHWLCASNPATTGQREMANDRRIKSLLTIASLRTFASVYAFEFKHPVRTTIPKTLELNKLLKSFQLPN